MEPPAAGRIERVFSVARLLLTPQGREVLQQRSIRRRIPGLGAAALALALAGDRGPDGLAAAIPQGLPFDGLLERLADAAPELRAPAVEQYLNLFGRLPLIEGDTAIFLAEGETPPRVTGDFTGAGEGGEPIVTGAMTRIEGTDWYYLTVRLDPAARLQYRIAHGETARPDPRNPRQVVSFDAVVSELRMPGYRPPPEVEDHPGLPAGRLVSLELTSRVLANSRTVRVYLPPGYDGGDERYPVAYFGDGAAYVEEARVPAILDHAIAGRTVRPVIAVLVDPVNRREEYRMSPDYRRFFVEELVPLVDRTYRTIDAPTARVVAGGSRGALAAIDLAFHHAERFAFCIAFSPAIRPTDIDQRIEDGPRLAVRFFVTGSRYDAAWLADARRLRDALRGKGYDLTYLEIPEGHDILAWRARIDDALGTFFPGR